MTQHDCAHYVPTFRLFPLKALVCRLVSATRESPPPPPPPPPRGRRGSALPPVWLCRPVTLGKKLSVRGCRGFVWLSSPTGRWQGAFTNGGGLSVSVETWLRMDPAAPMAV